MPTSRVGRMSSLKSRGYRRAAHGFTLIELMVVLVIMATLSAAILPSIASALRRTGLRATRDKLCDLLNFAYMSAVSRGRPVEVNLDPSRRACWVSVRTVSLPWLDEEERETEIRTLATMELPEGTEIVVRRLEESRFGTAASKVWETIAFRSEGGTEDVFIELTNPQGERFEIEIIGATGKVRIVKEFEG